MVTHCQKRNVIAGLTATTECRFTRTCFLMRQTHDTSRGVSLTTHGTPSTKQTQGSPRITQQTYALSRVLPGYVYMRREESKLARRFSSTTAKTFGPRHRQSLTPPLRHSMTARKPPPHSTLRQPLTNDKMAHTRRPHLTNATTPSSTVCPWHITFPR